MSDVTLTITIGSVEWDLLATLIGPDDMDPTDLAITRALLRLAVAKWDDEEGGPGGHPPVPFPTPTPNIYPYPFPSPTITWDASGTGRIS